MKYKLIPITSLDQLQVGDIVKTGSAISKVILDKTTHLVALSLSSDNMGFFDWYALKDLVDNYYQLQVTDKPWKPTDNETYYYPCVINGKATISSTYFIHSNHVDETHLAAGMCFQTEAEALAAAQKMLDAIKPNQL